MLFEGSEKKVEIALLPTGPSFRERVRDWRPVVAKARATVLSSISNGYCDAYLLSESSLFVYDRKLIMITCGTTQLIDAVEEILSHIEPLRIAMLMYERKNEHFPEEQASHFDDDVVRLKKHLGGEACSFADADGNRINLFYYKYNFVPPEGDMTLEMLMHGLSDRAASCFSGGAPALKPLYEQTEIRKLFTGFRCDDYMFEPMGYSLNGIGGAEYYTIHVTPQSSYSYASFETNHLFIGDFEGTVRRVLDIFEPDHFTMVLFERHGLSPVKPEGYFLQGEIVRSLCGYRICFLTFKRESPAGVSPTSSCRRKLKGSL